MSLSAEFMSVLKDSAQRLGRDLSEDLGEVKAYAATRMLHLSRIIGQPGYTDALIAERDAVAMKAGLQVVDAADAADRELLGLIGGALAIGARALAP